MHRKNFRREMEYHQLRLSLWRIVLELLKITHHHRFPGRRFGADLALLLVYGASVITYMQGRKIRASHIARYLQMPNETTRRYLKELQQLDLLEPEDHSYRPTAKTARGFDPEKIERLIRAAAKEIM